MYMDINNNKYLSDAALSTIQNESLNKKRKLQDIKDKALSNLSSIMSLPINLEDPMTAVSVDKLVNAYLKVLDYVPKEADMNNDLDELRMLLDNE